MSHTFRIGFSKIDLEAALTPVLPIRERIEAISAYIEADGVRAIWMVLDFMDFDRLVSDRLKAEISAATSLDSEHIHILTTHNHGGGKPDVDILARLVAGGAVAARDSAREAVMRCSFTSADRQVSILRRLYIPEMRGTSTLYFGACEENGFETANFSENVIKNLTLGRECNNISDERTAPRGKFPAGDGEIFIMEFRTPTGEPLGSVIRFAAHAVCANRQGSYSSDYPFHARRCIEEALGGVAMFLNGPCGEIAPAMHDKFEGREKILGEYIAKVALSAIKGEKFENIHTFSDEKREVRLPVRREMTEELSPLGEMPDGLPERKSYLDAARFHKMRDFLDEKYRRGEPSPSNEISVFLGILKINDVMLLAFPGETFFATGDAVKRAFPDRKICTVTEHERTVMYLPPEEEFLLGGYESACKLTAPNAESILRAAAIEAIRK